VKELRSHSRRRSRVWAPTYFAKPSLNSRTRGPTPLLSVRNPVRRTSTLVDFFFFPKKRAVDSDELAAIMRSPVLFTAGVYSKRVLYSRPKHTVPRSRNLVPLERIWIKCSKYFRDRRIPIDVTMIAYISVVWVLQRGRQLATIVNNPDPL